MQAPRSILEEMSEEWLGSPEEVARLVCVGEEVLSRAKLVAQRIDEQCRQAVTDARFSRTNGNGMPGSD